MWRESYPSVGFIEVWESIGELVLQLDVDEVETQSLMRVVGKALGVTANRTIAPCSLSAPASQIYDSLWSRLVFESQNAVTDVRDHPNAGGLDPVHQQHSADGVGARPFR